MFYCCFNAHMIFGHGAAWGGGSELVMLSWYKICIVLMEIV